MFKITFIYLFIHISLPCHGLCAKEEEQLARVNSFLTMWVWGLELRLSSSVACDFIHLMPDIWTWVLRIELIVDYTISPAPTALPLKSQTSKRMTYMEGGASHLSMLHFICQIHY